MKNDKIEILSPTETRSAAGGVVETWTTTYTMWADVEQVSGNEGFSADMIVYNDVKSFTIYYNYGQNVTAKMRVKYRNDEYNITSISHERRLRTKIIAVRQDDE